MASYKILALDESGKASYNHFSKLFILSGVIIPEEFKIKLDRLIKKLKRKYFQNEEIVFHGREILRKKGPFAILQDSAKEINFWSDFINIINNRKIDLIFIITNKQNARLKNWHSKTILKRSYLRMLEEFAKGLKSRNKGKIINESDPSQDLYLIQAHNLIQSIGTTDKNLSGIKYRKKITCLSLVNKLNLDVDVQIADTLASAAEVKYNLDILEDSRDLSRIEKMRKRLIERKISHKSKTSVFEILI